MTQTLEKWDSHVLSGPDLWMVWRWYLFLSFIYLFFLFCLEAMLGEDT